MLETFSRFKDISLSKIPLLKTNYLKQTFKLKYLNFSTFFMQLIFCEDNFTFG